MLKTVFWKILAGFYQYLSSILTLNICEEAADCQLRSSSTETGMQQSGKFIVDKHSILRCNWIATEILQYIENTRFLYGFGLF